MKNRKALDSELQGFGADRTRALWGVDLLALVIQLEQHRRDLTLLMTGRGVPVSTESGFLVYQRKRTPNRKGRRSREELCGAMTRKGTPCQCLPVQGKRRCKFHGGGSTGPITEAGREAIRESNRRRAKSKLAEVTPKMGALLPS